jgi:hypothetical protein
VLLHFHHDHKEKRKLHFKGAKHCKDISAIHSTVLNYGDVISI